MFLQKVTLTGFDGDTPPGLFRAVADDLGDLAEFGILLSAKKRGCLRFPDLKTILGFPDGLNYSLHVCGNWALGSLYRDHMPYDILLQEKHFKRVQLNIGTETTTPVNREGIDRIHKAASLQMITIIQVNNWFSKSVFQQLDNWNVNVVPLLDSSGGSGLSPDEWPESPREKTELGDLEIGYAGGHDAENIAERLDFFESRCMPYWIDLESGLRDEHDRVDPKKVERFVRVVREWVDSRFRK